MMLIAEFGSSPALGWDVRRWCETAREAGADACKIQLFRAEHFPLAEQDSKRPLEFPRKRLAEFVETAHSLDLQAGASVFDTDAARLVGQQCDFLKLAAREYRNERLIKSAYHEAAQRNIQVYMTLPVVDGTRLRQTGVTLFTVPEQYPCPMWRGLLCAIQAANLCRRCEHTNWGISSHTTGLLDCILAARLGAAVVERRLALTDTDIERPHSLLPAQFKRLAAALHR